MINIPTEQQLTLDLSKVQWDKEGWYWGRQFHSNVHALFSTLITEGATHTENQMLFLKKVNIAMERALAEPEGNCWAGFYPTTEVGLDLRNISQALSWCLQSNPQFLPEECNQSSTLQAERWCRNQHLLGRFYLCSFLNNFCYPHLQPNECRYPRTP